MSICTQCKKQLQNMTPGSVSYVPDINNPYFCTCHKETKFIPKEFDQMKPPKLEEQITLSDRFAMAALTGLLADPNVGCYNVAELSYELADAMIEARKK